MIISGEEFVQVQDYAINLRNVSSFKISPKRLIFNMNYSVSGKSGLISDFIFINEFNNEDINKVMDNKYFKENFFKIYNGNSDVYVNKNSVVSYKYEKDKNRYVLNFNSAHTYEFSPGVQKTMAEFMYAYDVL